MLHHSFVADPRFQIGAGIGSSPAPASGPGLDNSGERTSSRDRRPAQFGFRFNQGPFRRASPRIGGTFGSNEHGRFVHRVSIGRIPKRHHGLAARPHLPGQDPHYFIKVKPLGGITACNEGYHSSNTGMSGGAGLCDNRCSFFQNHRAKRSFCTRTVCRPERRTKRHIHSEV